MDATNHGNPVPKKTVAVIGAGMVGIATASFLIRDGFDVVVIDPAAPGQGASFGNAGCFNPSSVVPIAMPGTWKKVPGYLTDPLGPLAIRWQYLPQLAPWLLRYIRAGTKDRIAHQARALRSLLGPCLDTLMPLVRDAGAEAMVARNGILMAYRTEASWRGEDQAWALRRQNGIRWEELDADELRQFDPGLSREYIKGRLIPDNGHSLNPGGLVAALADAMQRDGGRIFSARATDFEFADGRLRAVVTSAGKVPADFAVIAAGIHSRALADLVGDRVPLESERGYHMMIAGPPVMPRVPTTDADGKFVATPMANGLRLAGTVEFAGVDAKPNWQRARILLKQAKRLYPALAETFDESRLTEWMGHRPSLPDSLPVLGRSTRSPNVLLAFGHGHVGMTGGPFTGKIMADLISNRPPPIDLAPFRANRF